MTATTQATRAEAGRRGPDVRSDCWIALEPATTGGITVDLNSRVESLYGDSIHRLAADILTALGVEHARIEIDDTGALPFVIQARIEAAVRRLVRHVGPGVLPDWSPNTQYPTTRERFRRSRLYLPGNEPKFMLNAGLHGPDGVILDLEDSVAPAVKDEARLLVRNALRTIDFGGAERMVRINQGDRGLADLDAVVPHNLHVVLIPKVEDPEHVRAVDERIDEILRDASGSGAKKGARKRKSEADDHPTRPLLMPIVESARGALRALEIATASPNICALTIGLEDYTADIGAQRTAEGRESFWARSQVVNAARAAGVQPIDTVFSDIADADGLRAAVLEARGLGFDGKGCIHPRQIRIIHEAFAPTPEELDKAQRIVVAFEEAQAKGLAAVSLGSKMIDPPVVKRAQRVVALAAAARE